MITFNVYALPKIVGNHPPFVAALIIPTVFEPDGFSQNTMANVTSGDYQKYYEEMYRK